MNQRGFCGFLGPQKTSYFHLAESMKQTKEIVQGKRAPSRRFVVDAISVKKLRSKLGLGSKPLVVLKIFPEFPGPACPPI
jgi:hypothetical protein